MRSIALLISATVIGNAALQLMAPGVPPLMTDPADAAAESTIAIQRGTRVGADLQNALSTESTRDGDAVLLRIREPVIAGERVVIPEGTLIDAVLDTIAVPSVAQGVAIELLLTRLRYPGGETVRLAPAPVAVPNDSAPSAGSSVRAVVLLRGASEYHLAAGSRMEIVLQDSFVVDRRLTVAAAPSVREGRRSRDEGWCWVAGSPSTPDIRIPGTAATPAIGDMPALPGSPDIVVPGIPSPPGKWAPCP